MSLPLVPTHGWPFLPLPAGLGRTSGLGPGSPTNAELQEGSSAHWTISVKPPLCQAPSRAPGYAMKDSISALEELEVWGDWHAWRQHPGRAEKTGTGDPSGRGRRGDESYKSPGAARAPSGAAGGWRWRQRAGEPGWAPGTSAVSSGAAGSKNPEEGLPTVPGAQSAFWATFTIAALHARRRFQGVALTFQLLQAACHLPVLFLSST